MNRHRFKMRLALSPQQFDQDWLCRNASENDAQALAVLMVAAYRGSVDSDGTETVADALTEINDTFRGRYGAFLGDNSFLVTEGDAIVGACLITLWHDAPLVAEVMVQPNSHGQGMGTFLLKKSIAALCSQGYPALYLYVTEGNPAQQVYARLGFQIEPDEEPR